MTTYEQLAIVLLCLAGISGGLHRIWQYRRDRTIVRVTPQVSDIYSNVIPQGETLGIKVINESRHAITVEEIGVFFSHTPNRMVNPLPITTDGKTLPCRLGPFDNFLGYYSPGIFKEEPDMVFATHVYARLSDGKFYKGKFHFNPAKERAGVKL